jgi:hypothetical protein
MKYFFVVISMFLITIGFSQEFMGIHVSGSLQDAIFNLQKKGFKRESVTESGNVVVFKGRVSNSSVTLVVHSTPKTKLVWAFKIIFEVQSSWYELKSQYNDLVKTLTNKYGEPTKTFQSFLSPYYEGDGYEMSALRVGKVVYLSSWNIVYIKINKSGAISIQYENTVNSDLDTKEQEEIDKNIF